MCSDLVLPPISTHNLYTDDKDTQTSKYPFALTTHFIPEHGEFWVTKFGIASIGEISNVTK